jgi:outer membrane protein TolC
MTNFEHRQTRLHPIILQGALAGVLALALGACTKPAPEADAPAVQMHAATDAPAGPRTASLAQTPFGQSVAQAVRSYPALTAGAARIRAAQAALEGEQGNFLPQVSIGAESGMRRTGNLNTTRSTPVLQIQQLVYDGGASAQREEAARARIAQSSNDRLALGAALTLQAVDAWFEVLHRRQLVDLANRNMRLHSDFQAQIADRVRAGAGAETDLLTAQSRLADATARQVTAQSRLDRAEAEFRQLFGHPPANLPVPNKAPSIPGGTDAIVNQSPRLRSLDSSIRAAEAEVEAARAGQRPSLVLGITGQSTATGRADVGANLSLQYDLATGGRRKAAISAAEARVLELEAEREDLSRQIGRALDFVRSDQRAGAERVRAARQARNANEANVRAVREQFSIGRRTITELLDAQRDFIASSEGLLEAELDLNLSGYAALSLTGDILDVFGIVLATATEDAR